MTTGREARGLKSYKLHGVAARRDDPGSRTRERQEHEDTAELGVRIDDAERDGRLPRREAEELREDLAQLETMRGAKRCTRWRKSRSTQSPV